MHGFVKSYKTKEIYYVNFPVLRYFFYINFDTYYISIPITEEQ